MTLSKFNCFTIGVGGQGVIRATHILADAAMAEQYPVRTAETHGMAQRGGSVSGYLRFGKDVHGPLIPKYGAHVVIALEPSEALRSVQYANKETYYFINSSPILPLSIYQNRKISYPNLEIIEKELSKITPHVHIIDALGLAEQAGTSKSLNVVMLGFAVGSGIIPLKSETIEKSIEKFVPKKALQINKTAFQLGFDEGGKIHE